MLDETSQELISAALDGERVDVQALREILDTAEGCQTLASFFLIRAAVSADEVEPTADACAADRASGWRTWVLAGPRLPAGLAASIAALTVAGSFFLGFAWRGQPPPRQAEPVPVISVPVVPPASGTATVTGAERAEPPTPTRRLEYVRGMDWRPGS